MFQQRMYVAPPSLISIDVPVSKLYVIQRSYLYEDHETKSRATDEVICVSATDYVAPRSLTSIKVPVPKLYFIQRSYLYEDNETKSRATDEVICVSTTDVCCTSFLNHYKCTFSERLSWCRRDVYDVTLTICYSTQFYEKDKRNVVSWGIAKIIASEANA